MEKYDYIIVGAGIVGLTIARSLLATNKSKILILEKESKLGMHASGKNSGVLHMGIYYKPDSMKAKFCQQGAQRLYEYAQENKISVCRNGKVIVAQNQESHKQLSLLLERARLNGARVEKLSQTELKKIEPQAYTHDYAIHSPDTGVIDSKAVLTSIAQEISAQSVKILYNSCVRSIETAKKRVEVGSTEFCYGKLINCAGLYADKIAHMMDIGRNYKIMPFKGLFRSVEGKMREQVNGSIYPAPDLRFPFLGVHLTKNIFGDLLIGPTAIPALGRENYGLADNLNFSESSRMFFDLLKMVATNRSGIRNLVCEELKRYSKTGIWKAAQSLAPLLKKEELGSIYKIGLRAQLVDKSKNELVQDFVIEKDAHSLHVLNAISPAFTASFPFADYVVEQMQDWK